MKTLTRLGRTLLIIAGISSVAIAKGKPMTALQLVEEQLAAYNVRDINRFCAVFSKDIVAYSLKDEKILFTGIEAFRKTYTSLFADSPNLHAEIVKRSQVGDFIIDEEKVTGRRGQSVHAMAVYKIEKGLITRVWFAQ